METLPSFDTKALMAALDVGREARGLRWSGLADLLWDQSAKVNARDSDHVMCAGALVRHVKGTPMSCQYALILLRCLRVAPEAFLTGPVVDVDDVPLPDTGPDSRLLFDLHRLHGALDERRRAEGLTWAQLAEELGCTASRLTNLRTARLADMDLTMRITQWLAIPAATLVEVRR
jgi:hypothetical protein